GREAQLQRLSDQRRPELCDIKYQQRHRQRAGVNTGGQVVGGRLRERSADDGLTADDLLLRDGVGEELRRRVGRVLGRVPRSRDGAHIVRVLPIVDVLLRQVEPDREV